MESNSLMLICVKPIVKNKIPGILSLAGATWFTILFYQNNPGLNVGLFVITALMTVYLFSRNEDRSRMHYFLAFCVFMLGILYTWHGNHYTLFVLIMVSILWLGSLAIPKVKLTPVLPQESILSFFYSQHAFFNRMIVGKGSEKIPGSRAWRVVLFAVAFLIITGIFLGLYSSGNVIFNGFVTDFADALADIFGDISFSLFFTIVLGLAVSNWFVFHSGDRDTEKKWLAKSPWMQRIRRRRNGVNGLKSELRFEFRTGLFLFAVLNLMLFVLNLTDVYMVWFGFKFKGQLLKDFVHEGTWNLIVSIVISAVIMLWYFRANINFYSRNRWLKTLGLIWTGQNVFLAFSLVIRNWHYISNYGLAYRRIGIFFFLAAVLAMLVFVALKIIQRGSLVYFVHRNLLAAVAILTVSALPDWSPIITRYNFSHYKHSFVHISYLADMPDRCLPIMHEYRDKLDEIGTVQKKRGFGYSEDVGGRDFPSHINFRTEQFLKNYPKREWQEYCPADARAFDKLRVIASDTAH